MTQYITIRKLRTVAKAVKAITGKCTIHVCNASLIFEIGLAYGDEERAKADEAFDLINTLLGQTVFWRRHYRRIEVCGSTSFQNPLL